MRNIVIGDLHGCIHKLSQLFKETGLRNDDRLFFVGDIVDRGPDVELTIKIVKSLVEATSGQMVLGNHDLKFLKRYKNGKLKDTDPKIEPCEYRFLAACPLMYRIPGTKYTIVHGGIPKRIFRINEEINFSNASGRDLKYWGQVLFTRWIDEAGDNKSVPIGTDCSNEIFWANRYDGGLGTIIFGHQPFKEPQVFKHAIGIDTGAAFGNKLTAVILEEGLNPYFASVDCSDLPGIEQRTDYPDIEKSWKIN